MRFLAIKKTTMSNTNASKATVAASEAMQVVKQVAPKPRWWAHEGREAGEGGRDRVQDQEVGDLEGSECVSCLCGYSWLDVRPWHDKRVGRTHFRTAFETPAMLPFSPKSLRMSVRRSSQFF